MLKLKEKIVDLKTIYEPSKKLLDLATKYGVIDARHDIDWKTLFEMRKDFGSDNTFTQEVLIPEFQKHAQIDKIDVLAIENLTKPEVMQLEKEKNDDELKSKEEEAQRKELEVIQDIKNTKTPQLDKYYRDLDVFVKAIENTSEINGLVIIGDPGVGKSTYIRKRYEESYVLLSGHITPKELYLSYLNHPNGWIVIDDPTSVYNDKNSLGILLQATQTEPIRTIHWHSSTLKVNKATPFYGKTILIQNCEMNNDVLENRCLIKKLKFDFKTKIKMLYEFAKIKSYPLEVIDEINKLTDYPKEIRDEVLDKRISFRTAQKLVAIYNNDKNWKSKILEVMGLDDERINTFKIVIDLRNKCDSVKEMETKFIQLTGKSRATFYLIRKMLSISNRKI